MPEKVFAWAHDDDQVREFWERVPEKADSDLNCDITGPDGGRCSLEDRLRDVKYGPQEGARWVIAFGTPSETDVAGANVGIRGRTRSPLHKSEVLPLGSWMGGRDGVGGSHEKRGYRCIWCAGPQRASRI